jgi:hypothetical protein
MNRKEIRITLDQDTLDFLEWAQNEQTTSTVSDFINSLLRQERFRQGYLPYQSAGISHIKSSLPPIEKAMLERSGLLPLTLKPRR